MTTIIDIGDIVTTFQTGTTQFTVVSINHYDRAMLLCGFCAGQYCHIAPVKDLILVESRKDDVPDWT